MDASRGDRSVQIAGRLLQLGISHAGCIELLQFPLEQVEQQLEWLPFRAKVKRPGAFLINAVRNHYSPPKEFYYAKDQIKAHGINDSMDQNP